jgi:hypothetical protein
VTPLLWSAFSFCLGLLLGHRLALGRDRRREFNDAALPVREWLLKETERAGRHRPSAIQFDTFEACLSPWNRYRFRAALERHRSAIEEQTRGDGTGGFYFEDEEPIKALARRCLEFTNRR